MAIKSYLELTNEAMAECKVSLDPLTSLNFASPPRTGLYTSFKRWVNKAHKDLMIERHEWFFRVERAKLRLYPRLHLSGLTYIPVAGDVLVGATSGVSFTVKGVHTFETNERDTVVARTVDVEYNNQTDPRNFDNLEQLNRVSPLAAINVGFLRGAGRYNFADAILGFDQLDEHSVRSFGTDDASGTRVESVEYVNWINRYSYSPYSSATSPSYITQTPDGNYELFPQPSESFVLEMDFSRKHVDMVEWNDTPITSIEKYQDILVWMAISEFADYDNQTRLFSRASKNIDKYNYQLNRDTLPTISFGRSQFDFN